MRSEGGCACSTSQDMRVSAGLAEILMHVCPCLGLAAAVARALELTAVTDTGHMHAYLHHSSNVSCFFFGISVVGYEPSWF